MSWVDKVAQDPLGVLSVLASILVGIYTWLRTRDKEIAGDAEKIAKEKADIERHFKALETRLDELEKHTFTAEDRKKFDELCIQTGLFWKGIEKRFGEWLLGTDSR